MFGRSLSKDSDDKHHYKYGIGDLCEALWEEDGEFYPAEILRVDRQNGTARVLFSEYGNYGNVYLSDLRPLSGSKDIDIDAATTLVRMSDFDPTTGETLCDGESVATGGGSMGGGGGGARQRHRDNVVETSVLVDSESKYIYLLVMTGKGAEFFSVRVRVPRHRTIEARRVPENAIRTTGCVRRLKRFVPPRGVVTATASRRGGQSALRFSRIAEAMRKLWITRLIDGLNDLIDDRNPPDAIYVVGTKGLENIMRSESVLKRIKTRTPIRFCGESVRWCVAESRGIVRVLVENTSKKRKVKTMLADHDVFKVITAIETNSATKN